jgi:crotonobetainyl-CoA:carnitine CoA-transferase CaiB-like acyl-CoA transferase
MSTGPLEGIKIVELGQGIPAAVAGMHLGDGGADVIKVETPDGDVARTMPPFYEGGDSAVYVAINRNKRSLRLDLAAAEGRAVLRELIAGADALIEDVDFTRELALDLEALIGANDQLVHCRISGYGPHGPLSDLPGGEITAQMASEATLSLGSLTEAPVRLGTDAASSYAGVYACHGILAALWRRFQDGLGQKVDVSLFGCMLMMRATLWAALSNPDDWFGFHNDSYVKPADHGYQAKDGALMLVVGRLSEEQWASLLHDLKLEGLTDEEKHLLRTQGGVNARMAHITKPLWERGLQHFTVEEAAEIFGRHGGNAYRINDYPHLFAHPQTQHLDLLRQVETLNGPVTVMRPPWQFSADPVSVRLPPPALGQHTNEVLSQIGYDAAAIERLQSAGALG